MDAVKKLNENFLSCSICTERFNDPCTLGCGHTFCKVCLAEFTKTRLDAIAAKSILCPTCRQMTRVPDPDIPVEDWTKPMKPHFLIQGLLDEFEVSDDSVADTVVAASITGRPCFPCEQIGKVIEAECLCQDCDIVLCKDCVKMHQTMPGTKNHTVTGLEERAKGQGRRNAVCREHGGVLEFVCMKCKMLVCPKCGILYHGKCEVVVMIDSLLPEMKSVVQENKTNIMHAMEGLQTHLTRQQSVLEYTDQNKASVQSEIRRVAQQAVDRIQQEEKQLMEELDELTEKQSDKLRGQIQSGEIDLQMYQRYQELIGQALSSENLMDLYDVYQMCLSGAVRHAMDREGNKSVRSSVDKITFVNKMDLKTFDRRFGIGSLELLGEGPDLTKKPSHLDTVDIRLEGESAYFVPSPSDVTVLDVDGVQIMVVTDNYNNYLKSICTRNGQTCKSKLKLNHSPQTVSKLKQNQVVVSLKWHNAFLIVQVTPGLTLHSLVTTQKKYSSLTELTTNILAAGGTEPPSIDILDLSGQLLRSVTTLSTGQNLRHIFFLHATDNGQILVSDKTGLYCVTPEGKVIFTIQPQKNSKMRGIATTPSGHIFVADIANRKVFQLTQRGDVLGDLLSSRDGMKKPRGVCLHHDKLYVTEYHQGTVKVFQFK